MLIMMLLYHYVIYQRGYNMGYTYYSVSNSAFLIGVLGFFPGLMAASGSYKLFYGIQYALKSMVNMEFKSKHRNISDFLATKKVEIKSSIYTELLLSSSVFLLVAFISNLLWDRQI